MISSGGLRLFEGQGQKQQEGNQLNVVGHQHALSHDAILVKQFQFLIYQLHFCYKKRDCDL